MNIRIQRRRPLDNSVVGTAFIDDDRLFSFSLERLDVIIPAGTYPVILTFSGRVARGRLWSPDPRCRLPELLDVPGRTGIRIHAANLASELQGCIAIGKRLAGTTVLSSRTAVEQLMERFDSKGRATLEIKDFVENT